jgi:hypothetical protein
MPIIGFSFSSIYTLVYSPFLIVPFVALAIFMVISQSSFYFLCELLRNTLMFVAFIFILFFLYTNQLVFIFTIMSRIILSEDSAKTALIYLITSSKNIVCS